VTLTWDDSYAIARSLRACYPEQDLEQVSLEMIFRWTIALPDFEDEPGLANDQILAAIYQEWFEEAYPL
jgi:FeS assembly protein IscX